MNIDSQRRVDRYLGVPLCRLLSLLPRARDRAADAPPPKKILVILLSEMGSLFLAHPMLCRLRARYPEAALYALVFQQNKEALELLDIIPEGHILTVRNSSLKALRQDSFAAIKMLRFIGIDTVVDCELFSRVSAIYSMASGARVRVGFERHTQEGLYRGSFINRPVPYNPYQHIAQQFLTLAEAIEGSGVPTVKRPMVKADLTLPRMRLVEGELETARRHFEDSFPAARGQRLVLLYPGGGLLPIRAWPIASYVELASAMVQDGCVVGVIGLVADKPLARELQKAMGEADCLDVTGYTKTVRELMVLFHLADLLVTNDGGPGHFAAMTPVPSVILYGPETPVLYGSLHDKVHHFYLNLSCSPCVTAYNHRASPCDGDNQCLKRITPAVVIRKAKELLGPPEKGSSSNDFGL